MLMNSVLAGQGYVAAKPATKPSDRPNMADAAAGVARDFATTLVNGEQVAEHALIRDADPHALVQAMAQTELAVEAAVTVRNKVVEAYQEILRMPV